MNDLWKRAIERLRPKMAPEVFETWFGVLRCESVAPDRLVVRIPNPFYEDILQGYLPALKDALQQEGGLDRPPSIQWKVDPSLEPADDGASAGEDVELEEPPTVPPPARPSTSRRAGRAPRAPSRAEEMLHPRYTFESFVVGPSNQLAHAASLAVAEAPGRRYNPLFLYGGVGLGKTHLMNAIGRHVLARDPGARILYVSAERFTNEFVRALQHGRIEHFHRRYREQCDVLLLDDVQFLASKEQTQEEFFHTFNALHHMDRQVVVSSDVEPSRIAGLQERLISRFQSGLVADVQPPQLDTRIAILRAKARVEGIELADEVAELVARHVLSNVRELEGMLTRLVVRASLEGRALDVAFVQRVLGSMSPGEQGRPRPGIEVVQRVVAAHYGLRVSDLRDKNRARRVTLARQVAMYLCRTQAGASLPEIGRRFARDHTTVLHAERRIAKLAKTRPELREELRHIEETLRRGG